MEATTKEKSRYIEAVGRRKTSIARVRLHKSAKSGYEINGKDLNTYFPTETLRYNVKKAFAKAGMEGGFTVTARITGGGINSQSEAMQLGIARALMKHDLAFRLPLKQAGLITRDGRIKERRKFGLKKARKSPQWSKR